MNAPLVRVRMAVSASTPSMATAVAVLTDLNPRIAR